MARWVPDDRTALDRPARDIAAMYGEVELRLIRTAQLAVMAAAGDPTEAAKTAAQALEIGRLREVALKAVDQLRQAVPGRLTELGEKAATLGYLQAARELGAGASRVPGARAAAAVTADLSSHLEDVHQRILRAPDDIYRRIVGRSMTTQLVGTASPRTSQAEAWNRLLREGVSEFTDKAGRRWNLATYVEMATRTAARKAWEDEHLATLDEAGAEFFTPIVGNDSCKRCCDWSGKILTYRGRVGQVEAESILTGEPVTVDVDGLVSQWRGQRHPNCTCRLVGWQPGTELPAATTYSAAAEAARAKLRRLEVDVRKAKIVEAAAASDTGRRAARAEVRRRQALIRAHVDETGLLRQREREQINLGFVRLDDGPSTVPKTGGHPPLDGGSARPPEKPTALGQSITLGSRADRPQLPSVLQIGEPVTDPPEPGSGLPVRRDRPTVQVLLAAGLVAPVADPWRYLSRSERATAEWLEKRGLSVRSVDRQPGTEKTTPDVVAADLSRTIEFKGKTADWWERLADQIRHARKQSSRVVVDARYSGFGPRDAELAIRNVVAEGGQQFEEILVILPGDASVWWSYGHH